MVALVSPESACTSRFEAHQFWNPKHGKSSSGRSSLRTMAQILSMMSHDQIKTVSFDQNTQIIKIQIQENMIMYVHVWFDSSRFNHGSWCVLTPNYLRNTMEWLVLTETCWNMEHDFCQLCEFLRKIGLLPRARVSSLVLVNVIGIYRV